MKTLSRIILPMAASVVLVILGFWVNAIEGAHSDEQHIIDRIVSFLHVFNYYDFGFIKRGLVGSLFKTVGVQPTQSNITTFSILMACLFILTFWIFLDRCLEKAQPKQRNTWIWIAILCPALFLNTGYMLGYFDIIGCSILLLSLLLLDAQEKIMLPLIMLMSALAVLIHEAYVFLFLPTLLLILFVDNRKKQMTLVAAAALGTLALLMNFGRFEDVETVGNIMMTAVKDLDWGIVPNPPSIGVFGILTRDILQNMQYSLERYIRPHELLNIVISLIWLGTFISLLIWTFPRKKAAWIPRLLCLPMIVLALVGRDFQRWVAWCAVSVLIFYLWEVKRDRIGTGRSPVILMSFLAFSFLLGPLGKHTWVFPFVKYLFFPEPI